MMSLYQYCAMGLNMLVSMPNLRVVGVSSHATAFHIHSTFVAWVSMCSHNSFRHPCCQSKCACVTALAASRRLEVPLVLWL